MNININNIQWGFPNGQSPPQDLFQEMYQICMSHPECVDCPYISQPVQIKDAMQICEIGIHKQKQGETQ